MSEQDIIAEWLQIAYEDYDIASYLFVNKRPQPLEIVCYHCQQSAEKSLKGFLCARGMEVPKTHEVGMLCRRCATLDSTFTAYFKQCDTLEQYATGTRYPSRVTIDEANTKMILKQTLAIYNFVLERIPFTPNK